MGVFLNRGRGSGLSLIIGNEDHYTLNKTFGNSIHEIIMCNFFWKGCVVRHALSLFKKGEKMVRTVLAKYSGSKGIWIAEDGTEITYYCFPPEGTEAFLLIDDQNYVWRSLFP